jgi:hypothetical protein
VARSWLLAISGGFRLCLIAIARLRSCGPRAALLLIVQLDSEWRRDRLPQAAGSVEEQQPGPALLLVVQTEAARRPIKCRQEPAPRPDRERAGRRPRRSRATRKRQRGGRMLDRGQAVRLVGVPRRRWGRRVRRCRRRRRRCPSRRRTRSISTAVAASANAAGAGMAALSGVRRARARRPCRVLSPPLPTIRRHQERPARGRASGLARASPGA